jgi:hypothetical protein
MAITIVNPPPSAFNRPMGTSDIKIWGHHCPTHEERGQSCWGVGWWWLMLVVVCSVCEVLCVVVVSVI